MTDTDTRSDVIAIKDFFGMSTKEARQEIMAISGDDRKALGEGIRNESFTY